MTHLQLKNDSGLVRRVKVGRSWTSFFFGGIPFFFRGMMIHGACWFMASVFALGFGNLFAMLCLYFDITRNPILIAPFYLLIALAPNIYLMLHGNRITAQYYLEHGYKPFGEGWETASACWNVISPKN